MKKHLSMILALLILFALPVSAFAALEQVGGIYQISTAEHLEEFRKMVNNGSGDISARLTEHIDLEGKPWTPIGQHVPEDEANPDDGFEDRSYRGTFDGGGFRVKNLTVTEDTMVYINMYDRMDRSAGLFGVLSKDAHVSDLSFEGVSIDLPEPQGEFYIYVGSVAGVVLSGDIQNCTVTGGTITTDDHAYAGGVAGYNGGDIQSCTVQSADISAGDDAGGIAGRNRGNIQNCTVTVETITGDWNAGGVAGYNDGDIQNCTVTGGSIKGEYAGGIAGYAESGNIQTCTVQSADISAGDDAGGIAGRNRGNIQTCTVTGGTITSDWDAGGVAGWNSGTILYCTAADAMITGAESVGGVTGANWGNIQTCTVTGGTITSERSAGGVAGVNEGGSIKDCAVFGVTVSAEKANGDAYSGAIVGFNYGGNIQNCVAMDGTEKSSVSASADITREKIAYAGGVLGYINTFAGGTITNTLYPAGIVNTEGIFSAQGDEPHEWAIGNISPDAMGTYPTITNVTSYNATQPRDELPIITAILEQGVFLTIMKDESHELDLTTLPGTSGVVSCDWSIEGEDAGILVIEQKPESDLAVTITGAKAGEAVVKCSVTGDITLALTCRVTVVEPVPDPDPEEPGTDPADPTPTPTGSSSNSHCNSGVGAAFFALAGLFFVGKQKR